MIEGAIIAVDPGEKRTGLAVYDMDGSLYTQSFEPWGICAWLEGQPSQSIAHVVLEQWVAYPDAAAGNAWRQLLEVRLLGALEWICKTRFIEYSFQPTGILIPTTAYANSEGYQWRALNRDEKAAETHLYHYMHLRGQ